MTAAKACGHGRHGCREPALVLGSPGYLEKQGTPIGPLDQQIAAHALDIALVTNNLRTSLSHPRPDHQEPALTPRGWINYGRNGRALRWPCIRGLPPRETKGTV